MDNVRNEPAVAFAGRLAESSKVAGDTHVSRESVFRDPVWRMKALVSLPGLGSGAEEFDFRTVPGFPGGFALGLAEYAYARMNKPVIAVDREADWLTVRNELVSLRVFARFCAAEGILSFHELDEDVCERYLQLLSSGNEDNIPKREDRLRTLIAEIYRIWQFRERLTQPMPEVPFGKPLEKLLGPRSGAGLQENATPPIPEPVFGPLMGAALYYVLEAAPAIIEAWEEVKEVTNDWERYAYLLRKRRGAPRKPLEELSRRQRARRLAEKPAAQIASKVRGDKPLSELSVRQKNRMRLDLAAQCVAQRAVPWRKEPWKGLSGLQSEMLALRTACILTVLAFSGMRSSELLSLRAGCIRRGSGADGRHRHYVEAVCHKDRGKGALETWVVVEEVVKAVEVLERLTEPMRVGAGDDRLLLTDGTNQPFALDKEFLGEQCRPFTFEGINAQINAFRRHCNTELARDPIPDWPCAASGKVGPWRFNCRQFRRTLARYIARQPFGVIAGMRQYKHVEVAIFEGYAGSEPDWNRMLEQEKVLASVDILEEVAMDLTQGAVAGELGNRLRSRFEVEFRGRAEDFPPSQIAKWLASNQKNLFVGKFNFCFFDAGKALCVKGADNKHKPVLNACNPSACRNACVGKRHRSVWKAQLAQAEELRKHPKASQYQRDALDNEIVELRSVVDSLGG